MAWSRLPLLPVVEGLRLLGAVGAHTQRIVGGAWAVIGGWAESGPGDPDSLADEAELGPEAGPTVPEPEGEAESAAVGPALIDDVPATAEPVALEPAAADDASATAELVALEPTRRTADDAAPTPFPELPRRRYRAGWPPPPPVRSAGTGPGFRGVPVRPVPSRVTAEAIPAGSPPPEAAGMGPAGSPSPEVAGVSPAGSPSPEVAEVSPAGSPSPESGPDANRPPSAPARASEASGAPQAQVGSGQPVELIELTRRVRRVVLGAERFRDEIAREAREMATVILDDAAAEAQRMLEQAAAQRESELRLARQQASELVAEGRSERESLIARGRREVAVMIAEGEDELRRRGERIAELTGQITEMLERTTQRRESR